MGDAREQLTAGRSLVAYVCNVCKIAHASCRQIKKEGSKLHQQEGM